MYFPNEKAVVESEARFVADEATSAEMPRPHPNASPDDPYRLAFDSAYRATFKTEFEEKFKPFDYFYNSIKQFHIVALTEILGRFDFQDPAYNSNVIELVKPQNARALVPTSLFHLMERFPILRRLCDTNLADQEWRSHVDLPVDYFGCSPLEFHKVSVDAYWRRVFDSKNVNGEPEFPNLRVCISLLLCLPFSNASAERVFSAMKQTKTPQRNQLEDKTVASFLKVKSWLKKQNAKASSVTIPPVLLKTCQNVITNLPII